MNEIEKFIEELAKSPIDGNFVNIYDYSNESNEIRRNNLKEYLQKMQNLKPQYILVGEAPGFRGCRFTGIPFTSEFIISTNKFFSNNGYRITNENPKQKEEGTATIMWETLDNSNQKPLLWNAFPFHPYKEKNLSKNRTPKAIEREIGRCFLMKLLELFPTLNKNKIGAIGRVAEKSIKKIELIPTYIPHPSRKKSQFVTNIKNFFEID